MAVFWRRSWHQQGPTVGFLAHVDAPQFNAGVKPRQSKAITVAILHFQMTSLMLSPREFPYLAEKQGNDIITASGTTLLGADDKAGVAIIMTAARHLLANRDRVHGPIRIAFTPDEEIGRGVGDQLPKDLRADFAYTFDGGKLGEIEYETFSADGAEVVITGVSIHPGMAKDKMVNAIHLASKIISTLPQATLTPEVTDDRDGFIHATEMTGGSSQMKLKFIIRDFERDGLQEKGELLQQVCAAVQATEPRAQISCTIRQQYRNMRYWLENDMTPVDLAKRASRALGIEPVLVPIRRYGRISFDRKRGSHPELVYWDAKHPWPARMDFSSGHGISHRTLSKAKRSGGRKCPCLVWL